MTEIVGVLTDYAFVTEGEHEGRYTARIDDKPYPVMQHVNTFLVRLKKGSRVIASLNKDGHISKIQTDKRPAPATSEETATKMKKAGFEEPTPGPSPTPQQKEVPPERAPNELFTDEEVAAMKAQAPAVIAPSHPIPVVAKKYSEDEMLLLRNVIAKGCTEPEFKLLMYMANTYGLDPLLKQIWAVKRNDGSPALIFAGRDGMLAIAHRSGQFYGMNSGVIYEKKTIDSGKPTERTVDVPVTAWCEVWRKDMTHSFKTEVPFAEYNTGFSVWKSNPSAMILKVAESVCLRKAFSVSGLYCPEEINTGVN